MAVPSFHKPILVCLLLFALLPLSAQGRRDLILATTTSTQDSGLLDVLIPVFEKETGHFVKTIAVGSGQAIALGRRGEADVLLAHSPEAEEQFVKEGFGINRRRVMHNDFVILGPHNDPAEAKGAKGGADAFARIAKTKSPFFSRGDESGTHVLEKAIWRTASIEPAWELYLQTGLGMGHTLSVAAEKKGYTLSDRGTYLSLQKILNMAILCEGDPIFQNVYHVIEVSPEKFPRVNSVAAKRFADFLLSGAAQALIAEFGKEKYGSPLFFPNVPKALPAR